MITMAAQWFRARVAEHTLLASKFQFLHLELIEPHRIEFTAGQYIMLKVPGLIGLRQYSIASPPSMGHAVDLLVDMSPQGLGSKYLQNLKLGEEVEFMAPAGVFSVKEEPELCFVATGSGIAPIRSMIVDLLVEGRDKRTIWLHWGLRYPEDVFWFTDFAELTEEHDNFNFDPVLSRPSDGWKFCRGHVAECVLKHRKQLATIGAYLCGNKAMIQEVTAVLVEKGVGGERIHMEEFYG